MSLDLALTRLLTPGKQTPGLTAGALPRDVFAFQDTCRVYALVRGDQAVLIDGGDGSVLESLDVLGVRQVTDVLMTHHHRDQAQGVPRLAAAGARIWAPHAEQDLFTGVEAFWQGRAILNNYNTRQDRFSLLEPVSLAGTLRDYSRVECLGYELTVLPTPGHTPGSLTLLAEIDGCRVAFSGDLIAAPGKLWSLAATQWSYHGAEGIAATILSLLDLKRRQVDLLLPSHGDPISNPGPAIDLLVERLLALLSSRGEFAWLLEAVEHPFEAITPHLLRNRTSVADSYLLLSESGQALAIDLGYDFAAGQPAGTDRAARRPWLYNLAALKAQYGVQRVEAAIPTHYHDDHVAGLGLLQAAEKTQLWIPENFAAVLASPSDYDLPCLWYDPLTADRTLSLGIPFRWQEYTLCAYPLPGHTPYAVALAFTVDGQRVLAVGDQYQETAGIEWNYVYQNGFGREDYRRGVQLYRQLDPQLLLTGHWGAIRVQPGYANHLEVRADELAELHQALLPEVPLELETGYAGTRIHPYQASAKVGERIEFQVQAGNPSGVGQEVCLQVIAPEGWDVSEGRQVFFLAGHARQVRTFSLVAREARRRARIAVDLTVGETRLGQVAEALVTVD